MDAPVTTSAKAPILDALDISANRFSGTIGNIQRSAIASLDSLSFPTRKSEAWKYTSVTPLINRSYVAPSAAGSIADTEISVIDGRVSGNVIDTPGYFIGTIKDAAAHYPEIFQKYFGQIASANSEVFTTLNTAAFSDGLFVLIKQGKHIPGYFRINFDSLTTSVLAMPRIFIVAQKSSQAEFYFKYAPSSAKDAFTNVVAEFVIEENAHVEAVKLQNEDDTAFHVSSENVLQLKDSVFSLTTVTTGGKLVRNNVNVFIDGENCESNLWGLYLASGKQHIDNHTLIDHRKPHCNSNEHYKGIMRDSATGVFNGKVFVKPDAQKTNAFQSNQNILLSDNATVNSKPELEIYADDVKCSHGSTTGQFDEEAVFYLRSRGIGEDSARAMLVQAFSDEIVEKMDIEAVREEICTLLRNKLQR